MRRAGLLFLLVVVVCPRGGTAETISFNKHIRPLLADRCFTCPRARLDDAGSGFAV